MKQLWRIGSSIVMSVASLVLLTGTASASSSTTGTLHKPAWVAHPPIHLLNHTTATYQNGYNPTDIRDAYGLSLTTASGAGTTIAIVDAYGSPTISNDLAAFEKQFGISSSGNFRIANLGGHRSDSGWALETSLDVEWARALAPDANILLVEAKSASLSDLLSAVNYATSQGAQVVSMSWGGSEFSGESSYESYFNHPGVVYTASSGDNGAGVSWPAAATNVLSVGGTTLSLNSDLSWSNETAWSGSGGGVSSYIKEPTYQSGLGNKYRSVPDVSWDADPNTGVAVYDTTSYNGQSGWYEVGGTSFGAPSWAAVVADADQALISPTSNTVYNSSELLQAIYADNRSTYFHDIISGSNGGYGATAGYDHVTGIGSPEVNSLLPQLVTQGTANDSVSTTSSGGTPTGGGNGHGNGHK